MPDNIRSTGRGKFLVAGTHMPTFPFKLMRRLPVFRQAMAGLLPPLRYMQ